jgi:hypothetical protein
MMVILPLSLSFAYAEDDGWKTVEQNGFVFSAKINYNSDKTDIKSIDLKMENKTGEDLEILFASPTKSEYNWSYLLRFSNDEKLYYLCSTTQSLSVVENFNVPAKAVIVDTVYPKSEEATRYCLNENELSSLLTSKCYLEISTGFLTKATKEGAPDVAEETWGMQLSFDIDLNNSEGTTEKPRPLITPVSPYTEEIAKNGIPSRNPPTDVEGIAVALVTAITACGTLVITSKKK